MIATFYSYRGGVGRSMAMANVGELLAEMGYRVILCDWDLEAPGLERYLVSNGADDARYRAEMDDFLSWPGLVDLLREYKAVLALPAGEGAVPATADDETHATVGTLRLRRPVSLARRLPRAEDRPGSLRLLTAGRRADEALQDYAEDVRRFDWQEFYEQWAGGAYMDFFRRDLVGDARAGIEGAADILLIDSRTGVTEQGGICTHHLADLVVLLTAANDLNMEGAKWMARALADPGLPASRGGRPLHVLPVASRIEQTAQRDELVSFRRQFLQAFGAQIGQVVADAETFALAAEIPYMPFYSFHERVVAREPEAEREQKLHAAYRALADAVVNHGVRNGLLRERTAQGIYVRSPDRRVGAEQRGAEIEALFKDLAQGVQDGNAERIVETTPLLEAALRSGEGLFPEEAARRFLVAMRRAGHRDLIERIASAVLGSGIERPFMQIALARAQVDRGELTAALSVLQSLLPSLKAGTPDQIEARLLIGRICTDLYLDAPDPAAASSVRNLERAINEFYDVYRVDPLEQTFAGSNVFALLRRAQRDGVRLEAAPDAGRLAQEVLETVTEQLRRGTTSPWDSATAMEACLALDREEDAVHWADTMLSRANSHLYGHAFASDAVERQLVRMWRLSIDKEPGATLLGVLRGALLADPLFPGPVPWEPSGTKPRKQTYLLDFLSFENRPFASHYRRAAQLPASVVRLQRPGGNVGTGFLVSGSALDGRLGEGNVLLTAAHVFGPSPPMDAADLADWRIEFVGAQTGPTPPATGIRELLFCSPMDQLDVVVLRLGESGLVPDPLQLAATIPEVAGGARVSCIGAFDAGPSPLAIVAGELVAVSDPLLHYRIDSAPSGCPIFDEEWQVVGVHHAIAKSAAEAGATSNLSEGISIEAIRRRLGSALGQEEPGQTRPLNVFISYAHTDGEMVNELQAHLKLLERRGLIQTWSDRRIGPGESWDEQIAEQLRRADLVILAVTAHFLASEYTFGAEMKVAIERHRSGQAQIVPIILRACDWQDSPIAEFQVLPRQGRPITSWSNRDEAWTDVARAIRAIVINIRQPAQAKSAVR